MIKKLPILRIVEHRAVELEDTVACEHSATVVLNGQEVVTLLCSPVKLDYLAVGFLLSEGVITSRDDVMNITVKGEVGKSTVQLEARVAGRVADYARLKRVVASSGGRYIPAGVTPDAAGRSQIESPITISSDEVYALMEQFHDQSPVFAATGGVHSVALCDTKQVLVFSDDIGRHNAMDRMFGECLMKGITVDDKIVVTSGRVSSEILNKVARRGVPVIMSVSAPTDVAVALADSLGITLIGFIRGRKMNVYTHRQRVVIDDR